MKNIIRNIILVGAMGAVAVMCVGLALYEYVPSSLTIAKASQYERTADTVKNVGDSKEVQELLETQNYGGNSSSNTPVVKTNIVLKEYDVSKADLARYRAVGAYVQGRADPFAEVTENDTVSGGGATGTNTSTTSGNTGSNGSSSDGTFYNSSKKK